MKLLHHAEHPIVGPKTRNVLEETERSCEPCQLYTQELGRFRFTLREDNSSNHSVYAVVFYIEGKPALHVVNEATNFQSQSGLKSCMPRLTGDPSACSRSMLIWDRLIWWFTTQERTLWAVLFKPIRIYYTIAQGSCQLIPQIVDSLLNGITIQSDAHTILSRKNAQSWKGKNAFKWLSRQSMTLLDPTFLSQPYLYLELYRDLAYRLTTTSNQRFSVQ